LALCFRGAVVLVLAWDVVFLSFDVAWFGLDAGLGGVTVFFLFRFLRDLYR
jgi:hypothetical protein